MKSNGEKSKIGSLFSAVAITVGLVWVFFKLPGIIANKVSYMQLKKKDIK